MNLPPPRTTALLVTMLALLPLATASGADLPPLMSTCTETLLDDPDRVTVQTPLGGMVLQLFPSVAPLTVANFMGYIDRGDYAGSVFHRVVPNFVVQTGGFASSGIFFDAIVEDPSDPSVMVDNEPCISNVAGTIAMAKLEGLPDSATSQWFVNLVDNSANLDNQNEGFTVFGRVLGNGLQVAEAIAMLTLKLDDSSFPDLPPFYAAVQAPEWSIFRDSPVLAQPVLDSPAYGCFDTSQVGILLVENPQSSGDWEPDPDLGFPYTIISPACAGMGTGGTPQVACSAPGRRVLRMDSQTGSFIPDPNAQFFFQEILMDCDDIAASEASFDARLADIGDQLNGPAGNGFVTVRYAVPEPGAASLAATSLLVLAALGRRLRRDR